MGNVHTDCAVCGVNYNNEYLQDRICPVCVEKGYSMGEDGIPVKADGEK